VDFSASHINPELSLIFLTILERFNYLVYSVKARRWMAVLHFSSNYTL
jgi:hypothetical protein